MKKAKFSLVILFIALSLFSSIVCSSCKKNKDKRTCPTGLIGANCDTSWIVLYNNAFTGLSCTSNGHTSWVSPKSGISITGRSGAAVSVTNISTMGVSGETITWPDYNSTFPVSGKTPVKTFDVSQDHYYLYVKNANPAHAVFGFNVNYGTSYVNATPGISANDSAAYGIGYYTTRSNVYVHAYADSGKTWDWPSPYTGAGPGISIPDTPNAMVTLIVN